MGQPENSDTKPNTTIEKTPKPVKKGQIITATIEYEGSKGDGVTKIDNFTIIAKECKQGKTYELKINEVRATYAFANKIKEIPNRSAEEIMKQIDNKEE